MKGITTLDKLLTFIAACLGALVAADPFGLPTWVQAVAAILVVGFAAIGITGSTPRVPPSERG